MLNVTLMKKYSYLPIVARVDSIHNWLFRRLGLFLNEEHNGFPLAGLPIIRPDNKMLNFINCFSFGLFIPFFYYYLVNFDIISLIC